jgi:AraC-like DNA-binding protein
MKAIQKNLNDGVTFPARLVYKDTKSPETELPNHLHDWHEIVYVYGGRGTMLVNHALYEMNAGDLFLIPGNTVHRAFPDERTPVTSSALFFSPAIVQGMERGEQGTLLRCLHAARRTKLYKIVLPEAARHAVVALLESIQEELSRKMTHYRTAVQIRICDLLLTLNRAYLPEASLLGDSRTEPTWLQDSLHYIDATLADRGLTLSSLSKRASITPSHFSRVFKQATGMNVTEYVVVKRIMLAKELLATTDDSIRAICERCGLESESYFYRKFKLATGLTPRAYKKSVT